MEFFRHCPGCGRRFHVKLVSKKMVHLDRRSVIEPLTEGYRVVTLINANRTITIDIEDFQYTYKCQHCGHEWSEKHVEEHPEG